jgi:hypothetical protein
MQRANHKLKAFIPLLIGAATAGFEFLQQAFTPVAAPFAERRSKGRPKRVWTPREDAVKGWQATIARRRRQRAAAKFKAWRERMDLGEAEAALELERRLTQRRKAREAKRARERAERDREDRDILLRQIDAGVYGKF